MGFSSSAPIKVAACSAIRGLRLCTFALACLFVAFPACAQTVKPSPKTPAPSRADDDLQKHFQAARSYQSKGDQEHAATEYRLFLAQALRRSADLRSHIGQHQEAEKLFEAGLALSPQDPDLLLDFAVMRLDESKFGEAKSLAEKALQTTPGNPRAEYLIGNALCQQDDYKSAKPHLEAAVKSSPNFETGYLLGLTYLKLKDLQHAEMLFNDMIAGLGDTAKLHIYLGRAYRNGGFVERAVEELKKAVAKDPAEPEAHYFLGMAYLGRDGDAGFAEAEPEFRAELRSNPNDYRGHYLLGYILLKQHNLKEAETELSRAVELNPHSPDPLIYLGQVYSETERPKEAERALRSAIVLTDDVSRNNYQISRAHYLLGRILLQDGKSDEAKEHMRTSGELSNKALQLERKRVAGDTPNLGEDSSGSSKGTREISPADRQKAEAYIHEIAPAIADSYNNLGVISAGNQEFSAALDYFRKAGEWQPSLETLDRNLGMAAFYANQFDQAVEPLSRHVQNQPEDTRARSALALSLFALQKYGAVSETLKAIATEVDSAPELSYAYAVSQLKTGDYNEGIGRLHKLEEANFKSADLHVLLGNALADQNDWDAALQEYRRALAIDPKQAHTHFLVGLGYIHQGSPADAAQEMRAALRLDPADVPTKYHLAFALIEMNKKDEALPLLREVLQHDPKHGDAYYQLGKLQLEQGDTKAAISNLEAGTKFKPDSDYIHYQLAMAYRRAARTDDANRELKVYQALKSSHRGRAPSEAN
jgi:tetratricopeptide (TPR) repeat protein